MLTTLTYGTESLHFSVYFVAFIVLQSTILMLGLHASLDTPSKSRLKGKLVGRVLTLEPQLLVINIATHLLGYEGILDYSELCIPLTCRVKY